MIRRWRRLVLEIRVTSSYLPRLPNPAPNTIVYRKYIGSRNRSQIISEIVRMRKNDKNAPSTNSSQITEPEHDPN